MDQFGKRLEEARKAAGLSQVELARKTGLSKSTICNYESGRRKKISQPVAASLAKALGVTWQSLLGLRYLGTTSNNEKIYEGEEEPADEVIETHKKHEEAIERVKKNMNAMQLHAKQQVVAFSEFLLQDKNNVYPSLEELGIKEAFALFPQKEKSPDTEASEDNK